MKTLRILTNQSFGKWRVTGPAENRNGRPHWRCECECGAAREVAHSNLIYGLSISCGCSKRTHGHTLKGIKSPTMRSYQSMVARCIHPSNPAHEHYQARGITICDRWLSGEAGGSGFECFLSDMGERPSKLFTIERTDNRKGYEPSNCCWATRREQARNRSTTNLHTYQGEMLTLRELSEKTAISYEVLRYRVTRRGLPVETAISLGPDKPYRLPV
jgi:hypothetical protein